jgi:hypothetical protein
MNGINSDKSWTKISTIFSGKRPGRKSSLKRFIRNKKRAEKGMMASRKTKEIEEDIMRQSSQIKFFPAIQNAFKKNLNRSRMSSCMSIR